VKDEIENRLKTKTENRTPKLDIISY